jgi:hypothetical protein
LLSTYQSLGKDPVFMIEKQTILLIFQYLSH